MNASLGLHEIEHASRDEIMALQLERLKATLHNVYNNVPYHRKRFDEAGVHPDDLKSLEDLSKFPKMDKDSLRDVATGELFAVPKKDIVRLHASSGTTGKPVVVGYTRSDIDNWADLMARSIYAAGGRSGDVLQNAYGYGLFTGGLGAHYGAERLGASVIPISAGNTERQVQSMLDFKSNIFMSTPSYAMVVAEELIQQGFDPDDLSLTTGIFGAEPWTNDMRLKLEQLLGINALNIYGLTEVMGPGVASECVEAKDGPIVWEDHFYVEVLDPETGEVLPDGEVGELVFTSLTKEAFPVVRFQTRDLASILPPTSRSFRRMGPMVGRIDDMLIVRGVNLFPTQVEEYILQMDELSGHYLLEVNREGLLDTIEVKCELRESTIGQQETIRIAKDLQRLIKNNIGISATINIVDSGVIPRSSGKAIRVVDNRNLFDGKLMGM